LNEGLKEIMKEIMRLNEGLKEIMNE